MQDQCKGREWRELWSAVTAPPADAAVPCLAELVPVILQLDLSLLYSPRWQYSRFVTFWPGGGDLLLPHLLAGQALYIIIILYNYVELHTVHNMKTS